MAATKLPAKLYKFRAFNHNTLEMLVFDQLFFADPNTFNDPLDTKPSLVADIENDSLESMLTQMLESRFRAEMGAAAKKINYSGPKTIDHILRRSKRQAQNILSKIKYEATNPDFEEHIADPQKFLLVAELEQELLRRYNRGVFSMAEKAECPLMWSHYGDQHKGIAIGYSIPAETSKDVHRIKYGGSREVEASAVAAMLKGDETAELSVDDAVLLRKAQDWRYEKEWRLLGDRGVQESPLEMEEVIFGLRCPYAVQFGVVKALADRTRPIKFYEIHQQKGKFILRKRRLDIGELMMGLPRRSRSWREDFASLPS